MEQIRAGGLADMQSHTSVAHLPTPATPFVGREAERKQIGDYLAGPDQRLITLYAPGGSGKTRLVLEIVAEQAPLWQDGVWFTPLLADVPAPEQLVDALAGALHLRATGHPVEAAQLIGFLRPRESLLILDSVVNGEYRTRGSTGNRRWRGYPMRTTAQAQALSRLPVVLSCRIIATMMIHLCREGMT